METAVLLDEIASVLPPVPKPGALALTFHESGCVQCEGLRDDLEQYQEAILPNEAIRYLHGELSCLSAGGMRWVLPSYLYRCVTQDTHDPSETEFLIYALGPSPEYEVETRQRLSALTQPQVECLLHFLEWCKDHPHWSAYCPDDISRGLEFIRSLLGRPHSPAQDVEEAQ